MAHDRGVILDVDGTLIDSNDAHARAWVEVAREFGHDGVEYDEVRRLIGMGGDKLIPIAFGVEEESPEGERMSERRGEVFRRRYLPGIEPFPGVRRLVERLKDDGFEVVVATSASADDRAALLDAAGVADLLDSATDAGDAEDSKPDPDIIEAAISKARVDRERLIMIGDTPYDVEAARRARVPIVAVRSGGWEASDLEGAVAVYDDVAAILADYERVFLGSP